MTKPPTKATGKQPAKRRAPAKTATESATKPKEPANSNGASANDDVKADAAAVFDQTAPAAVGELAESLQAVADDMAEVKGMSEQTKAEFTATAETVVADEGLADPLVVSPLYEADEPALRSFVAAQCVGELIERETMAVWAEGTLNGLIQFAADQCRAYEGVNSEALYLALEGELRKVLYWPNASAEPELDKEGRETSKPQSLLWPYEDARPDVLAWVEVFARTVDFLDQLHRDHPPAVAPPAKSTDDTEAA